MSKEKGIVINTQMMRIHDVWPLCDADGNLIVHWEYAAVAPAVMTSLCVSDHLEDTCRRSYRLGDY